MKDIALWLNDVIVLATGVMVWRYVKATTRLVQISEAQLESQTIPVIIADQTAVGTVQLVNIGRGPAIVVEFRLKPPGIAPEFHEGDGQVDCFSFLQARETRKILGFDMNAFGNRELHCAYRSISGQRYASVNKFTEKGIFETKFYQET